MRIATLNTWGPRGAWSKRLEAMRAEFARIDADIITLQETVLTAEFDQAALMLGSGYRLAQQTVRESGDRGVPAGQGITTASSWPLGEVVEVDLNVTERTADFACACLITEVLAPEPLGRIWVANHFPDYQLDHERERLLQAHTVARALEQLIIDKPGHVIVAGDMDADPSSDSLRFWTGRHVIGETSVCYRSATEATRGGEVIETYTTANPFQVDQDWPFRSIDHVLVRCGHSGPSLIARSCRRAFDAGPTTVSDHYDFVVDYDIAADTEGIEH
ncbi:endonuclease/exonuclease/phosphatase family protein [Brachybacterium sacelli]|nr:endonuclease/exonuclease/phosphatase family protein [Brachybacterium sacelli]